MPTLAKLRHPLLWLLCLGIGLVSWRFVVLGVEAAFGVIAHHAAERPLAFFAHVTLGPLALMLLPLQLLPRLRARRPALHRWVGRVTVAAMLLSGLGGLLMAFGTRAGPVAAAGFGTLAVLWLATATLGLLRARARDIPAHRRWMTRAAALTLAGVTLRIELPLLVLAGLEFDTAYTVVGWLCWVPNLLVAEWLLHGRPRPAAPRAVPA